MVRMLRKLFVSFYIAVLMFSNVPYQFFSAALDEYLDTRNVVDTFWLAQKDGAVVDKFKPLQRIVEDMRVDTAYAANGDGKIIYGNLAGSTPMVRDYVSSTNTFSSPGTTATQAAAAPYVIAKSSPTKVENVVAYQNSSGVVQVMCYDGATWTNEWSATVGSANTRRFDVAYEKTSGDVMVVYSTNTNNTNEMAYRTKLGSAGCGTANWSAATNLDPVRTTGIVQWIRLEGSPASGSNNIALAWADGSSDLSAMIWTGAAWGIAEPAAALETALEFVTSPQDTESFDIAFESTTGNLMVAWGLTQAAGCTAGTAIASTNCIRYARYTNAWSAVAAIPTVADPATHIDMSSNPNSNEIVLAALDNSQADLSAAYWSGSAWTGQANLDTGTQVAIANAKFVATGWLISGATTRSIITFYKSSATAINWFVGDAGVFTAQTAFTVSPVFGAQKHYAIDVDPLNKDRLMLVVGDGSSDIHAKQLVMTATPAFTWTNSTGGNPIEASSASAASAPQDFEYTRFATGAPSPTLTIGVTAGSKLSTVSSGATSQTANDPACASAAACAAFTILPSTSETLTSVKLTQTGTTNGTTNLSNVAIFYDTDGNYSNGTTGQFGSTVTTLTTNTATVSGSLAMTGGTTYYLYVRYDAVNGTADPAGGETVNWQIAANADVVSGGGSTKSGAAVALAGTQTVKPNATSTTFQLNSDGARSGYSATVTGFGFGIAPVGSRGTCAGAVNTGCVQYVVGGTATVATADVTAWSDRSITYTVNSALASNGGTNALQVSAGNQTDGTPLTFFVYPTITSITNCNKAGFSSGSFGREYDATDSACPNTLKDGSIVITGDHFGAAGTISILGSTATQAAVAAFCSGAAYNTTCTSVQVPTAIASNAYTGSIIVTRTSDSKTDTLAGFRVLPRITGFTPTSASNGTAVAVNGDHFCQTGTCPTSFGASDKVTFTSAVDATVFTSWTDTAMTTTVPAGAITGNVTLTSNSFVSNTSSFTVLSNTPSDPTSLNQYSDSGLLAAIATGGGDSSTPLYLTMTMQVPGISGGTLYPEVEYKVVGTPFTCVGTAACASATEGTGVAGPGPISCSNTANACSVAISPADDVYHWQARVCHSKGGTHTSSCGGTGDFPSGWVSFGGNAESATDFQLDATPPVITLISSGSPTTNGATITWSTAGEISSTQLQYNTTGSFVTNCATNSDCTTLTDTSPRVNNHSVTLSNLNSNTTYSYRVRSIDASGNESISSVSTFQTSSVSQPSKTVKFGIMGEEATLVAGGSVLKNFTVTMPENGTTTKSIFVEIRGMYSPGLPYFIVQVNGEGDVIYNFPATLTVTPFKILHRVNSVTTTPNGNTLTISSVSDPFTSATMDILSADMYVNYSYTP